MLGVIGDAVQDIVIWLQESMRPATDTRSEITMRRGGSAANVAAFAAKRCPTRFIGCVGDDLGAVVITRELESKGVDVRMQVDEGSTGMIVVLIDHEGERMMFPSRAASAKIRQVDNAWLEDLEILHLTGYSLQEEPAGSSVLDAARRAKDAGARISFDISSTGMIDHFGIDKFKDIVRSIRPDFISANDDECRFLDLATPRGPGEFLAEFSETVLLARAGKNPTRVFQGTELVDVVPVTPSDDVRDMTGAGDAFNAGFLAATLRGDDLTTATQAAHALARRVLSCPGASEPED